MGGSFLERGHVCILKVRNFQNGFSNAANAATNLTNIKAKLFM